MKKYVLAALIILCLNSTMQALTHDIEVGAVVGFPTGAAVKLWAPPANQFSGVIGVLDSELAIQADYLFHKHRWIKNMTLRNRLYFGVGALLNFKKREKLGIRFPVGYRYVIPNTPAKIYTEVAPIIVLTPDVKLNGSLTVGVLFSL